MKSKFRRPTEFDKAVAHAEACSFPYRFEVDPETKELCLYLGTATEPQRYTQEGKAVASAAGASKI